MVVSICHSFRSTGQPGRINGFDRCFQVVDVCTARLLCYAKRQILKFYQPHMGKQKPCKGIIEPHLGIIEPLLGITKLAEGINKPYLGDFVISSAASEAKTSIIARTPAIIRTNLFKNY